MEDRLEHPLASPGVRLADRDGIGRRHLLRAGAVGGLAAALGPWWASTAQAHGSRLFRLGVASGDPGPRSVVLWTRLAPAPLDGGGMGRWPVPVYWEVSSDPRMKRLERRGLALALPRDGHAVHVTVEGLDPDRWYYYRFHALGEDSPRRHFYPRSRPRCRTTPTSATSRGRTGAICASRSRPGRGGRTSGGWSRSPRPLRRSRRWPRSWSRLATRACSAPEPRGCRPSVQGTPVSVMRHPSSGRRLRHARPGGARQPWRSGDPGRAGRR